MNTYQTSLPTVASEQSFIRSVYNWMALGLGLSAFVSFSFMQNPELILAYLKSPLKWVLPLGELGLVFWMSARLHTFTPGKALFFYFLYAFLNGVTLTPILLQYTNASIFSTLLVTGATFAVTSFFGYTTKKDLSGVGGLLIMGIIGLIIASLLNIWLKSPIMYWVLTYVGVGLSVGLTAYYTQQIKEMGRGFHNGQPIHTPVAIMGALMLYIAFVMMFVYILRILGDRR